MAITVAVAAVTAVDVVVAGAVGETAIEPSRLESRACLRMRNTEGMSPYLRENGPLLCPGKDPAEGEWGKSTLAKSSSSKQARQHRSL